MVWKIREVWTKLVKDIETDHHALMASRTGAGSADGESRSMSSLLLTDPGLQSLAAIRLMHFARDSGIPKGGELVSRLIRYVYGMEVHWLAEMAEGMVIEHGPGLVISKSARIGPNCILSQHVTLGDMRDPKTGVSGAPTLENDVYVGPGSILLGPITIGAHARILAGCVVSESVPPHATVTPATSQLQSRRKKSPDSAGLKKSQKRA